MTGALSYLLPPTGGAASPGRAVARAAIGAHAGDGPIKPQPKVLDRDTD